MSAPTKSTQVLNKFRTTLGAVFHYNAAYLPSHKLKLNSQLRLVESEVGSGQLLWRNNLSWSWKQLSFDAFDERDLMAGKSARTAVGLSAYYGQFEGYLENSFRDNFRYTGWSGGLVYKHDKHTKVYVLADNQFERAGIDWTIGTNTKLSRKADAKVAINTQNKKVVGALLYKLRPGIAVGGTLSFGTTKVRDGAVEQKGFADSLQWGLKFKLDV